MKLFLRTCPLIAITLMISFTAAVFLGAGTALAKSVPSESASAGVSSCSPPSSVPADPVVSTETSSAKECTSAASRISPPQSEAGVASEGRSADDSSEPETERNLFCASDRSYFNDALFIGDSLTEDLQKYGGLEGASFFTHVGLNIYQLFEKPQTDAKTGATLRQMLQSHRYGKIYVLLGINEMGTGTTGYFARHYSAALSVIRELQPKAILYVQSILPVAAEKSDEDPVFNNPRIRERNEALRALANGRNIFYFDLAAAFRDESGNLPQKYSGDDVHIKAKYYPLWTDYLLKNTVPSKEVVFP